MRRRLLSTAFCTALAATSGCTGRLFGGGEFETDDGAAEDDHADDDRNDDNDDAETETDDERPVAAATVGEPSDDVPAHPVRLRNEGTETRSLELHIRRGEETVFEDRYDLAPGEFALVSIAERGEYAVTIRSDGEALLEDRPIGDRWFDHECSGTDLTVEEGGSTSTRTTPDAGC